VEVTRERHGFRIWLSCSLTSSTRVTHLIARLSNRWLATISSDMSGKATEKRIFLTRHAQAEHK
jgi:hypothetical protein